MKSIKVDYDIEEKCKTFFATVEKRLVDMEKKMEKKATKQQVEALESRMEKLEHSLNYQSLEEKVLSLKSEIENLKSKDVARADKESMDGLVTERLNYFREQEIRKASVIIYGIKELDSDEAERVEEIDKTKVTQFFNEELKVQSVRIHSTKRVGKKTLQSDAANNTSGYIRPIKLTLDSKALKHRIYKQYWRLKGQKVKLSYG